MQHELYHALFGASGPGGVLGWRFLHVVRDGRDIAFAVKNPQFSLLAKVGRWATGPLGHWVVQLYIRSLLAKVGRWATGSLGRTAVH